MDISASVEVQIIILKSKSDIVKIMGGVWEGWDKTKLSESRTGRTRTMGTVIMKERNVSATMVNIKPFRLRYQIG